MAGFGDGVLRVLKVSKRELDLSNKNLMGSASFTLSQVLKPHNKDITALEFNSNYTSMASGVSRRITICYAVYGWNQSNSIV